jgi:hypothetical protein
MQEEIDDLDKNGILLSDALRQIEQKYWPQENRKAS